MGFLATAATPASAWSAPKCDFADRASRIRVALEMAAAGEL
jgi:hypothetical protein